MHRTLLTLVLTLVAPAFALAAEPLQPGRDYHSFANADELRVRHLELFLDVDFAHRRLSGVADLRVERLRSGVARLVLDTRDLIVRAAWLKRSERDLEPLAFALDSEVGTLGQALRIEVPQGAAGSTFEVRISYQTRPGASGLQWLTPAQTAGKTDPFLFSQSQAIHARSWIPLQDSPKVRITYAAQIRVPPGLRAVMSADNDAALRPDGVFRFNMPQPIPAYLIAIAAGRLDYRAIGARTAVYAEPPLLEAAAREFAETESMLEACERLFGPYRWGRYDLLILPPAFPYGGMENPRLSFITPTVIAGDRSLVSLIAHELAHSWSGNLVTNATWRDFWLNEGFTTYLERRILDELYGARRRSMEDVLGLQSLRRELATLPPQDQVLAIDLRGRDPDEGTTDVPYEKGRLFLGWLSSRFGARAVDEFLRGYFERFQFQSITTEQFRDYLAANLLARDPTAVTAEQISLWIEGAGLPPFAVLPESDVFTNVDALRARWLAGRLALRDFPVREWSTFEWLHLLDNMPARLAPAQLEDLDRSFALTQSQNAEIAHSWLRIAIRNDYRPAFPRLEQYLLTIGRRKLIRPLYEDLRRTARGSEFARRVYAQARPGYHPIAVASLDPIVFGDRKTR
jgi:aminopeptidase N